MRYASLGVLKDGDKILILLRGATDRAFPSQWCLPGGMSDAGETPEQTLVREFKEETNIDVEIETYLNVDPPGRLNIQIKTFAVIADEVEVTLSEEHEAYMWATLEEMEDLPMAGYTIEHIVQRDLN